MRSALWLLKCILIRFTLSDPEPSAEPCVILSVLNQRTQVHGTRLVPFQWFTDKQTYKDNRRTQTGTNVRRPGDADGTTRHACSPQTLSSFIVVLFHFWNHHFCYRPTTAFSQRSHGRNIRKGRRRSLYSVSETTSFFYSEPDHHETPQRQQDVVKQPRTEFILNLRNIIKVFITCWPLMFSASDSSGTLKNRASIQRAEYDFTWQRFLFFF